MLIKKGQEKNVFFYFLLKRFQNQPSFGKTFLGTSIWGTARSSIHPGSLLWVYFQVLSCFPSFNVVSSLL
jgi:hypothetical protein